MSLRDQICDLREYLDPTGCAKTLEDALDHYNSAGQQILTGAQNLWGTGWPQSLPTDLAELLRKWHFPAFEPIDVPNIDVTCIVGQWHRALFNVIDRFCEENTECKVLCGFNVVNDLIFYLGSDAELESLWKAWGSPTPGKREPSREPQNLRDVLGCLIEVLNDPSKQGKFSPASNTLAQVLQGAQQAGLSSDCFVGGAAANNAYVLGHMGAEVHLHCPYHSDGLNWGEMASTVQHLEFTGNNHQPAPVTPGEQGHPVKTTVGFQSLSSPQWAVSQLGIQANEPGRALFVGRNAVFSPRPWQRVRLIWKKKGRDWNDGWQNGPEVWPYPAIFGHHPVQDQKLEVRPIDQGLITQWVQQEDYNVALLRDVGYNPRNPALEKARKEQLDALRAAGVPIHVEVSPGFDFALLEHLISGSPYPASSRWSAALNPDELLGITHFKAPYLFPGYPAHRPEPNRERLLQRFARAQHLMNLFDFDWIYIHGNELDFTVWRSEASDRNAEFGEKIRDAMLLAKAAVVGAMIERTPGPRLRQFVMDQLQQGSALTVKGFWALIAFAQEFSKWAATRYGADEETICKALKETGYCDLEEFGVAVAPVFWPDAVQNLNATGAGDYSSAVVAAYVWR